ncbi:MAG: MFS transporter [Acidimicrobiia bacterium]|nr:MFS transporter [Acidimicrobiia bacterium]
MYFATWVTDVEGQPDEALSYTIAAAMLVVILANPWIGARTDHAPRRVPYLAITTLVAVGATALLASLPVIWSLAVYGLALIGFNLGSVVYDSMLPDVSTPENRGRISGIGIGVGYFGSFMAVIIGRTVLDGLDLGYPALFRSLAAAFLVFSIPTFLFVRERPRRRPDTPPPAWRDGFRQLAVSWRRAAQYPGLTRFLVGRFLYSDAINTMIGGFLAVFVIDEIGFERAEMELLLGGAIIGAMFGGFGGGRLVDRFGPRRILHAALYMWMVAMGLGIVAAEAHVPALGWFLGIVGGIALGATWASDRVYMVRLSPQESIGEFYGLYGMVGRFATVLGPLTWGIIVDRLNLGRSFAVGALIVFLVAARIVLGKIRLPSES